MEEKTGIKQPKKKRDWRTVYLPIKNYKSERRKDYKYDFGDYKCTYLD